MDMKIIRSGQNQIRMEVSEDAPEPHSAAIDFANAFEKHQAPLMDATAAHLVCPVHGPLQSKFEVARPSETTVVLTITPCCNLMEDGIDSLFVACAQELSESVPELWEMGPGDEGEKQG
ncbi:MAG: hypothetical protein ACYC96_09820 [Fimbriimonadaceae bacterium]